MRERKGTAMDADRQLRGHLKKLLAWQDAHVGFEASVDGISPRIRGIRPAECPHSAWELLEHLRICQWDILEFCTNPGYVELKREDYWPSDSAPASPEAWEESIAAFLRDRHALERLALDPAIDLFAAIPHGQGQTYLRELLLVADHNAYHIGQLVLLRRLVGAWRG
jgi:uncharacterized damage-inducible protein DinB